MDFEKYHISKEIAKALKDLGYETLTKVQQEVIPLVLANKDIIVRSQTGSGKTAAFAIPVCKKMEIEQKKPQVLVLTPTRELAVQLKEDISNIGRFKRIRCAVVFGRQPMEIQRRELNRQITKIRINAGKKTKMRPGDILGALTTIPGISGGDIGIIDVQDTCSYVYLAP